MHILTDEQFYSTSIDLETLAPLPPSSLPDPPLVVLGDAKCAQRGLEACVRDLEAVRLEYERKLSSWKDEIEAKLNSQLDLNEKKAKRIPFAEWDEILAARCELFVNKETLVVKVEEQSRQWIIRNIEKNIENMR